jgi:hypothetical protein
MASAEVKNNNSNNSVEKQQMPLPVILDGKYFTIDSLKGDSVIAKCVKCKKLISGMLNATSNFVTHLKRMHPSLCGEFQKHKGECAQTSKLCKKTKRTENLESECVPPKKQMKLFEKRTEVSQKVVDGLILKFIVNGMQSMRTVETQAFKDLVTGLFKIVLKIIGNLVLTLYYKSISC